MGGLTPQHDRVGREYDENDEAARLDREDPIEYAITARYLQRYVPDGAVVADIGVGGGQYSELLARRDCRVHLVDVSRRLLDTAAARLHSARLGEQIASVRRASATDLSHLPDASCDVVLLLGPLYHLLTTEERRRAVGEAARILRPDGMVFAAGINLLTFLRDIIHNDPEEFAQRRAFFLGPLLHDGNLTKPDGQTATMHLTTVGELRSDLGVAFDEVLLIGVESFASKSAEARAYLRASPEAKETLLDLVERTGTTLEGLGATSHYLYIGRRKTRRQV